MPEEEALHRLTANLCQQRVGRALLVILETYLPTISKELTRNVKSI